MTLSLWVSSTIAGLSPDDLKRVGFDQHLGQTVSHDLTFKESNGARVRLGELLNSKPTLLVLGYYHCPMLCTSINDGLIEALQELRFNAGKDFNVLNVSIDSGETAELAESKKKEYLRRYGRKDAEEGWHFLVGDAASVSQLANEAGFRYKYDSDTHEYAHPSGFVVLTPEGRISRYFFGVNFDAKELNSAIIAAAKGEKGSIIHELILLCCRYSPVTGKYGSLILGVLRVFGIATVALLTCWIIAMCRRGPTTQSGSEVT
jgi:protein SCO1/2